MSPLAKPQHRPLEEGRGWGKEEGAATFASLLPALFFCTLPPPEYLATARLRRAALAASSTLPRHGAVAAQPSPALLQSGTGAYRDRL